MEGFQPMASDRATSKNILKKRAAFLHAAKGCFLPRNAFVMQRNCQKETDKPRVGFTVTKKVGNAVVRNRIRRRLKEAIRHLDEKLLETGYDYVLVGRNGALAIEFSALCADIETTVKKLSRGEGRPARAYQNRQNSKKR